LNPGTKIEWVFPIFFGVLGSLVFCGLIAVRGPGLLGCYSPEHQARAVEQPAIDAVRFFADEANNEDRDFIRELYRDAETREWVVDFFAGLCGSSEIAGVVLTNADAFDIPPALAFALSWEESRFNPQAINAKNRDESIDRGLFQLNNRSFPNIEPQAFFNPTVNAWYGMNHLRYCLDSGGSEIAALAMYNAGTGRVGTTGAPKSTLDYIHRILEHRRKIELKFQLQVLHEAEVRIAERTRSGTGGIPDRDIDRILDRFSENLTYVKQGPRLSPLAGN
jgi:hypothetical protein